MEEDWHEQRKGNASAMVTVIREGSTREANLILEVVGVGGGAVRQVKELVCYLLGSAEALKGYLMGVAWSGFQLR